MIMTRMSTTALPAGALRLTDWGLIEAQGADAAKFLHGQLTQDVDHLNAGTARIGGYCSAKGRLLASFIFWRPQPERVWLACSADLLAPTLKRLSMFVLRAQCKLADASARQAVWGLVGEAATAWLGEAAPAAAWATTERDGAQIVRLPDASATDGAAPCARYLLVQPAEAPAPALPALEAATWAALEVRSGVPRIVAATVEQFVPQMVNLELVGGVSFQKGCYPGQEVVARSQYRGTLKRRAMLFDSPVALSPGQEIFHSADPGQPAGLVALAAARADGGATALVEIKLAACAEGSLHALAADGPALQPVALPYALPTEAA
ncbi:MAG: hypothetical protein RL223_4519 [Pseudomonadota bacterium]